MKKRVFIVFLILLMYLSPLVHADAIMGDEFLNKNYDKVEQLGRTFCMNGEDGYVHSKEAPGSSKEMYKFENGTTIIIGSIYKYKGQYWGITPLSHSFIPGWILMDDLLMYYSSSDYISEHQHEFYEFTGDLSGLLDIKEFNLWQWPGSDREKILYYINEDYELGVGDFRAGYAFVDGNGREWIYLIIMDGFKSGLSRGGAEGWFCISEPENNEIPSFNPAPIPKKWSYGMVRWSDSVNEELKKDEKVNSLSVILIVCLVSLFLAIFLAFMFFYLKRRKK